MVSQKDALAPVLALDYAGANTDAGHTFMIDPLEAAGSADSWALTSPGNVDWARLQDFASVSLDDMTHIAKSVIGSFYGKAPKCKESPA